MTSVCGRDKTNARHIRLNF